MKLELGTYECGHCGRRIEAPALNPYVYGEFLLRDADGNLAHLDAFNDATYGEVDALLASIPETARRTATQRAEVLRAIYGRVACDPGPGGQPFAIDGAPACPHCGARRIRWFEHPEPAPTVDLQVAPVTHERWQRLGIDAKLSAVRASAAQFLKRTPAASPLAG